MGKADMSRDYYRDLEVEPTAEITEIRKSFRKLALKWHPDRNPGRESEVNAKFQMIQSAHEILTDDVERRRYDAGRIRSNRFSTTTTTGTRGNPYANAGSQWAPPPKPHGTPRASAAGQNPSGASRYEKFNVPGSYRTASNKARDQETKKSDYEAFEKMKKNHPTGTFANGRFASQSRGTWEPSPKPPDTRYTPQSGREESNNQKHAPPPKTAKPGYEEWNAGEHGRQSPKKAGFMPGNPGGDEPPAPKASSAYYNTRSRASTANTAKAPEVPPRPTGFDDAQNEGPVDGIGRKSTPYATHGGEKTNPFESNIHRSKTTRERPTTAYSPAWEGRPRGDDLPSPGTREKHRSASPPRSRVRVRKAPMFAPPFDANAESPPKRNYSNINTSPSTSTAGNKEGGADKSNAKFKARAESDTSSEDEDSDIQDAHKNRPSSKKLPRREVPAQNGAQNGTRTNVRSEAQRKANLADFRKMYREGDPTLKDLCLETTGNLKGSNAASQPIFPTTAHRSQPSAPPLFTANNGESINTRFETGQWNGKFGADSFVNPTGFSNGPSRSRAASRSGRRSPIKAKSNNRTRSASASIHSGSAGSEQSQANNPPMESPTKPFAAAEWVGPEIFGTSTFAPPTPQGSSRPPFNQRTPSRKGSRAKGKTNGGKAAVVEDYFSDSDKEVEPSSSGVSGSHFSTNGQTGAPSPNAMDVDTPDNNDGASSRPGTASRPVGEPRNVPVEPLRPEWRAGAINGQPRASGFASRTPAGMSNQNGKMNDDLNMNFDDFKNVEPLFQPPQGLDSVNDLKSTLPFESKASNSVPLKPETHLTGPEVLSIPSPPMPPRIPSQAIDSTHRMSPASFQSYLAAVQAYLVEYHLYNEAVEGNFAVKKHKFVKLIECSGWGWLNSQSDETFDQQLMVSKNDRLVREKWAEAARSHEHVMEEFRSIRMAMKGMENE